MLANMELGRNVAAARERAGLSQAELARRAGVDEGHVGRIERGLIRSVQTGTLDKIARVMGLTAVDLMTGKLPRRRRRSSQ